MHSVRNLKKAYGTTIPKAPGLNNIAMLLAADEGKLRGMYVMGEEMALVDSNANHVQHILANLDFLVVQDMFLSKTARFADVIFTGSTKLRKKREHLRIQSAVFKDYMKY